MMICEAIPLLRLALRNYLLILLLLRLQVVKSFVIASGSGRHSNNNCPFSPPSANRPAEIATRLPFLIVEGGRLRGEEC